MASALHQLIAQQQGPNILGSAMQGLMASDQQKAGVRQAEIDQQRITLGQRQLAMADQEIAAKHQAQSEQFAANLAYQIKNEQDPARRAQLWAAGRDAAASAGLDTSRWPQQYNDQTQAGLDVIFNKVYGDQMVKADLASQNQKVPADVQLAREMGMDLRTPEGRQAFMQFKQGQSPQGAGSSPYYTPLQTSTGMYRFNARTGEIEPLSSDQGAPLLPVAIDPTVQANVVGAKETAKVKAKAGADAEINLPQTMATAEQTIALIDKAIAHPGRAISTGMTSVLPAIPGTDAADFRVVMDQIGGQAFLQAFESLKGGGQITEVEGRKATEAIGRLNRAQSEEEFVTALNELRDIARNGMVRAQVKANKSAGAAPSVPAQQPETTAQPAGGVRFLGFE